MQTPAPPPNPPNPPAHEPGSVLVVEDESDLVFVVRFNLELEGYRTYVASNGQAALALLEEVNPDVMLLDLMMPVLDGWAVLHEIRRRGLTRPRVVVVSARTGPGDRRRADDYKVDAFVAKPFDMEDLLTTIRALLPPPRRQE
ncbi:MAG TPA: response regulator [Actinomycetota bacterium]